MDIIRDRGVMARMVGKGVVENVYRLQIMNATEATQRYQIDVQGPEGMAMTQVVEIELAPVEERLVPVTVKLSAGAAGSLTGQKIPIRFKVKQVPNNGDGVQVLAVSTFLIPR